MLMANRSTDELTALLPEWDRFFGAFRSPDILGGQSDFSDLHMRLVNLRRRLRDGPFAPIRIAFFGPTGAGKSKLFSSLIGKNLSESGFRRPFTRRACYYLHEDWKVLTPTLLGQVELHSDDHWKDAILIDTPDFDSVEEANRREAERVFLETDAFLFVTDALKYADASTWNYLEQIYKSGKLFRTILNKANSPDVAASFRDRFRNTLGVPADGQSIPSVRVPELPLRDSELLTADHESTKPLQSTASQLASLGGPNTSCTMFEREGQGIVDGAQVLQDRVASIRSTLKQLLENNQGRLNRSQQRLERRLAKGLDPEVRDEVYHRVLARIEKIDIFRHARKVMLMPFRGLAGMVGKRWLNRPDSNLHSTTEADDPITSETFHLLEAELIRIADESRSDIQSQAGFEQLLDRNTFGQLRVSHQDAKASFLKHYASFSEWLATHARETASEITNGNKTKFFVSQVLFNTLLITAQVHTGGAFSVFEFGMDGILSPFVAKAVGMAIGNDKVKEFETEAHRFHQESLGNILTMASQRVDDFLTSLGDDLIEVDGHLSQIVARRDDFETAAREFRAQSQLDRPSGTPEEG